MFFIYNQRYMKFLYFVFSNLNTIILTVWLVFLIIVSIRYFRPAWVKSISYFKLILIAIGLHIFYALFITWGQYYVWASSDFTRSLLNSPLPKEVPFYEWLRPLFENHLGYFLHYVLGRVWLNTFLLFLTSGMLYLLFKVWEFYRGGFSKQSPELILILMLISGWPGVLVFIPLGFIFAILLFIFYYIRTVLKGVPPSTVLANIEPAFILATFVSLLLSRVILNML